MIFCRTALGYFVGLVAVLGVVVFALSRRKRPTSMFDGECSATRSRFHDARWPRFRTTMRAQGYLLYLSRPLPILGFLEYFPSSRLNLIHGVVDVSNSGSCIPSFYNVRSDGYLRTYYSHPS